MALSTHGKSHAVLSEWMISGTFPSVPRQVWILLLFSGSFYAQGWLATIPI